MTTIDNYPWHVNVDAEGYRETSDAIEENIDSLVDHEQEHGALFYAAVGNAAAEMLDYPEEVRADVPEEAEEAADRFLDEVAFDRGRGTAQALFGLVADASDHRAEYEDAFGEENVEPLTGLVDEISARVKEARHEH